VSVLNEAVPEVDHNCDPFYTNVNGLTVSGAGFETGMTTLVVAVPKDEDINGSFTHETRTRLVYEFTGMQPSYSECLTYNGSDCTQCSLMGMVRFEDPPNYVSSEYRESEDTLVAQLISRDPDIHLSNAVLSSDTLAITLTGTGWDFTKTNNEVTFWTCNSTSATDRCTDCIPNCTTSEILGSTTKVNSKELTYTFYQLSNINRGTLCTNVRINRGSVEEEYECSSKNSSTEVAYVSAIRPYVTRMPGIVSADTIALTVRGGGFDNLNTSNTTHVSVAAGGRTLLSKITEIDNHGDVVGNKDDAQIRVIVQSRTHLTLSFCLNLDNSSYPNRALDSCSLRVADNGSAVELTVKTAETQGHPLPAAQIMAVQPCLMRTRGPIHNMSCEARGTPFNSTHEWTNKATQTPYILGTSLDKDRYTNENTPLADASLWNCQCTCDQQSVDEIFVGKFCEEQLTTEEVYCFSRCTAIEDCNSMFERWWYTYVYSSYPNIRSPDPRYYFNYLKRYSTTLHDTASEKFHTSSYFMCVHSAKADTATEQNRSSVYGQDAAVDIASVASASRPCFAMALLSGSLILGVFGFCFNYK